MKTRIAMVALITTAMVLAGAVVAFAKGPLEVTITGPGIDKTVDLLEVGFDDPAMDLMEESALWAGLRSAVRLSAEPTFELGPVYSVAWVNSVPPGDSPEERIITQIVYPFAEPGPVIHTPSQVGLGGWGPEVVGWFLGPESLADVFVALGAPSPVLDTAPTVDEETKATASGPAPAIDRSHRSGDDRGLGTVLLAASIGMLVTMGVGWAALRGRTSPAS